MGPFVLRIFHGGGDLGDDSVREIIEIVIAGAASLYRHEPVNDVA